MILNSKLIEIPMEWEIEIIGDVAKKQKGKKPENLFDTPGDNLLPYLTISASKGQISQWSDKLDGKRVSDNQTLIVWDGASSGSVFKSSKGIVGSTLACLVFDEKQMNNEFAYYFLAHSKLQISSLVEGTGIPHVPRDFMDFFQILKPPLPEQQRIAEILSTVDELIRQTDAVIEETKRLKRGLMQDLLTQGIGHESFKRVSFGPVELKIPVEWTDCYLEDIAEIQRGASPRPIGDSKFFGGDVGWIRISDINDSFKYITNSSEYLSDLGVSKSVRVHPDEVLLSISASVGECVIVDFDACIHDGIVTLRNLSDNYNNEFLYYYLLFSKTRFISKGQTGTQSNINTNLVRGIEILVPPLSEQRRIAEILSTVDDTIQKEHQSKTKLEALKRGLMQDLLTGQVRVPVET
jgi:type I restriction enzyme S subunit